jgi:hypothetical protein
MEGGDTLEDFLELFPAVSPDLAIGALEEPGFSGSSAPIPERVHWGACFPRLIASGGFPGPP